MMVATGEQVRLTLREWVGILALLVSVTTLANGATVLAVQRMVDGLDAKLAAHEAREEQHETGLEKAERGRQIAREELAAHVAAGPHAGVVAAMEEIRERLVRIEERQLQMMRSNP